MNLIIRYYYLIIIFARFSLLFLVPEDVFWNYLNSIFCLFYFQGAPLISIFCFKNFNIELGIICFL